MLNSFNFYSRIGPPVLLVYSSKDDAHFSKAYVPWKCVAF